MNDEHPQAIDYLLRAWNESDFTWLKINLSRALRHDVRFVDPTVSVQGVDAVHQYLVGFRERFSRAVVRRASAVDSHHDVHRYAWELVIDGRVVLEGLDVIELDDGGRIARIAAFFGELPPVAR
jgi:hypothetical protein